MAFKTDKQRQAFFARIKAGFSAIPKKVEAYQENRRKDMLKHLAKQTKELKQEEDKVAAEIVKQQKLEAETQKVNALKAQLAELKRLKFQHSAAGKALESVKSDAAVAGNVLKRGATRLYGDVTSKGAKKFYKRIGKSIFG